MGAEDHGSRAAVGRPPCSSVPSSCLMMMEAGASGIGDTYFSLAIPATQTPDCTSSVGGVGPRENYGRYSGSEFRDLDAMTRPCRLPCPLKRLPGFGSALDQLLCHHLNYVQQLPPRRRSASTIETYRVAVYVRANVSPTLVAARGLRSSSSRVLMQHPVDLRPLFLPDRACPAVC